MRNKRKKFIFRKILRFESRGTSYEHKVGPAFEKDFHEWKKLESTLGTIQYRFRDGFADRTTARLLRVINDPMREFYYSLSSLFPKIAYSSLALILLLIITIYAIHGGIDHSVLIGSERIDDSNFISYMILEN